MAMTGPEKQTPHKILTKSMEHEMYEYVKGTESWCVLVEYVKENYYARFHKPSYHRYKEKNLNILLDENFDKVIEA